MSTSASKARRVADESPASIVRKFAARATRVDGKDVYAPTVLRSLIAAATAGRVAIARLVPLGDDARVIVPPPMHAPGPWAEVLFHHNGSALAALERRHDVVRYAVDLVSRDGFFAGRTHLSLDARHDEELEWEIATLDSSLSLLASAAADAPPRELVDKLALLRAAHADRVRS